MKLHHRVAARRDAGNVLPLVLVVTVVLGIVVAGVASYTTTGLRYGQTVEGRADRLAAADGGMRYAVERLWTGAAGACTAAGSASIENVPDINGSVTQVRCRQVGNGFDDTNGWALILTGEGIPGSSDVACGSGECALVHTQSGASTPKLVGGPVYMADLRFNTSAPIRFDNSQLLYTAGNCDLDPVFPPQVDFGAASLGSACTDRPWSRAAHPDNPATDGDEGGLFSEPIIPVLPAEAAANPPATVDAWGCKVFQPGYYKTIPTLGANNYFLSGNYVFDGANYTAASSEFVLEIKNQTVTGGRAYVAPSAATSGDTQFITNTPCNNARNTDIVTVSDSGATFYLKNGARIEINAGGQFEVLRRKQGKSYVSIHVLDPASDPDVLGWTENVIRQGPGANKDMAIHGLVWAPYARITFAEVTNVAKGQLRGGAVLSNVDLRSSASSSGFVIAVEPSDLHGRIQLDSTATLNGHSTTIRTIVDYRPTTRYTAVQSWRVID